MEVLVIFAKARFAITIFTKPFKWRLNEKTSARAEIKGPQDDYQVVSIIRGK
jgi:hypothetical protein